MANEIEKVAPAPELRSANAAEYGAEYGWAVIKGLLGAVPYAGTALNEVLFEARSRVKQARIAEFIEELGRAVALIQERKIDKQYLQSEEFSDLLEDVFVRVARTRATAKRRYFRSVLIKTICGLRVPDFSSVFLALLEEITDEELVIAKNYYEIYQALRRSRADGKTIQMVAFNYSAPITMCERSYEPESFKSILQSLIRKGLLFDDSYGRLSTQPYQVIEPTDLLALFYEWVMEPESNP